MPTIEIISGKHAGDTYAFQTSAKVGKDETCQISLSDAGVSRYHAEFYVEGGAVHVKDLGSSNGTYVNFKKRGKDETSTLDDQDIIFFGRTVTKFWAEAPPSTGGGGGGGGVTLELLRSTIPVAGQAQEVTFKEHIRTAEQVEVIRRLRLHTLDEGALQRLLTQART